MQKVRRTIEAGEEVTQPSALSLQPSSAILNGSKMTDYGAEAEAAANYFVKNRHEVEKAVETIVENIEKKQNNS